MVELLAMQSGDGTTGHPCQHGGGRIHHVLYQLYSYTSFEMALMREGDMEQWIVWCAQPRRSVHLD